ncbi:hypothetical protein D3C80_1669850 [compost metagenome]
MVFSLIVFLFIGKGSQQAIENGAGGGQELIIIQDAFPQAGQNPLDARRLQRLNTAYVQVVHQGGDFPQGRCVQLEAGLQGLEGDAVADVAEGGAIEIETEGIRRAIMG